MRSTRHQENNVSDNSKRAPHKTWRHVGRQSPAVQQGLQKRYAGKVQQRKAYSAHAALLRNALNSPGRNVSLVTQLGISAVYIQYLPDITFRRMCLDLSATPNLLLIPIAGHAKPKIHDCGMDHVVPASRPLDRIGTGSQTNKSVKRLLQFFV